MKHLDMLKLASQLKKICKEPEIVDIVLFGSIVKGKEEPRDIDLAIILKKRDYKLVENLSKKIRDALSMGLKIRIEPLFSDNMFKEQLYLTLIHEGFSVKSNRYISKDMKTNAFFLVIYDLTSLNHTQKTMFGYALVGRAKSGGLLKEVNGNKVGRNSLLIPIDKIEEIKSFLEGWKVKYSSKRFIAIESYF